jgi:hypothetical protein
VYRSPSDQSPEGKSVGMNRRIPPKQWNPYCNTVAHHLISLTVSETMAHHLLSLTVSETVTHHLISLTVSDTVDHHLISLTVSENVVHVSLKRVYADTHNLPYCKRNSCVCFTQACVCADSHNLPYCKCMQVHIISFTVSETVVRV